MAMKIRESRKLLLLGGKEKAQENDWAWRTLDEQLQTQQRYPRIEGRGYVKFTR